MYIGTSDLAARMSELFLLDVYVLEAEFGVSPHEILSAINSLEQIEPLTGVKPATQFKFMPLKGLWHKHYFSAQFLVKNIALELGKTGVKKIVTEVLDPTKSKVITPEMIKELARRVTQEPAETRDARKGLTGEWLIYLKHEGSNYYLCCNTHDTSDQFIHDRIMEHCTRDFPDISTWWKAEQIRLGQ
jgi:hypothetical protein